MAMLIQALKRAGILAFGLLFALAIVEIIPRALPGLMPNKVQAVQRIYDARNSWESMMRGDRDLGFALRAGLDLQFPSEGRTIGIRTVGIGVPGLEDVALRDIGTSPPYAGVALGDSFTFCDDAPAESCWVRKLSGTLGASIATLGVNGYSNLAEARLLEKLGSHLSPSFVLIGFFPNDFKDNLHFENWTHSGTDDYWTWMRRKRRSDVSETLARSSILYRLVDAARRYGARDTFEYNHDGLDFVFRDDAWWREVLDRPGQTPGFRLAEQAFDSMAASAHEMNAHLVILLFPFKEQVYWSIARKYYSEVEHLEEIDMDAPFAAVEDTLTKRGIDWCDLTPDLREKSHGGPQLYLRVGAHWTDAGNEAAAESIAACLRRLGVSAASAAAPAAEASVPRT